ncbi:MAG: D-alanyl-D-alanine carboxypeptidase [Lachnospiraceae bacterium]|nr:D-alanyl-D-alanine carboxypeptidase [Lachnospiraceae bacterium]
MKHFIRFKKLAITLLSLAILTTNGFTVYANEKPDISSEACVVIEGVTGKVIMEKNMDKELIPASITKIMTLLIIFDNLESKKINLDDKVTVSEYAASMGGSQVYLEPGETQTVNDMIKCISIASANDAAVAMAEHIAGNEQLFVNMMNERAQGLGMKHTHFMNCNGLDDSIESGHYTSALDVAIMSRELIMKYPEISDYSTVWMDSITHTNSKGVTSEFGLTNTNKLIRSYNGITGLKTGSTSKAKYCLSSTARRDGLDIIAVVMAAPDHKTRFAEAKILLDYGFANCKLYKDTHENFGCLQINVSGSLTNKIKVKPKNTFSHVFTENEDLSLVKKKIIINKNIKAPIKTGDKVGRIDYIYNNSTIGSSNIISTENAPKASVWDYLGALYNNYISFKYSL